MASSLPFSLGWMVQWGCSLIHFLLFQEQGIQFRQPLLQQGSHIWAGGQVGSNGPASRSPDPTRWPPGSRKATVPKFYSPSQLP